MTERKAPWEISIGSYLDTEQAGQKEDTAATSPSASSSAPVPVGGAESTPHASTRIPSAAPWMSSAKPHGTETTAADSMPGQKTAPGSEVRGDTMRQRIWAHSKAFLTADTAPDVLLRAAESVQRVVPTGRRIVVVPAHPNAGATTMVAATALVTASLRRDLVAAVEAFFDEQALSRRLGGASGSGVTSADMAEVLAIRAMGGNEGALNPESGSSPLSAITYPQHTHPSVSAFMQWLSRTRAVVLADAKPSEDVSLLRDAHAVVLCSANTAEGISAVRDLEDYLVAHEVDAQRLVLVSVALKPPERHAIGRLFTKRVVPHDDGFHIPFDAHLAAAGPIDLGNLAQPTRLALTELTGRLIDVSLGEAHVAAKPALRTMEGKR